MIGKTVVERGMSESEMCASNDVPALRAADDGLRVQTEEAPGEEEVPAVSSRTHTTTAQQQGRFFSGVPELMPATQA